MFNQLEFDGFNIVPAERRVVVTPDESPTDGKMTLYSDTDFALKKYDILMLLRKNPYQLRLRRLLRGLRKSHGNLIEKRKETNKKFIPDLIYLAPAANRCFGICRRCKKGHAYEIRLSGQSIVNCVRMWEESPDTRFESVGRNLREYSIYCTYCY